MIQIAAGQVFGVVVPITHTLSKMFCGRRLEVRNIALENVPSGFI